MAAILHPVKISNSTIDRTITGVTILGQSRPGSDGNERAPAYPKASVLLEPYHQIISSDISGQSLGGFYHLGRCSWCILQT